MYNNLDSPPPRSQFLPASYGRQYTRPWSPDPYEPLPSTLGSSSNVHHSRDIFNQLQRDHHDIHQGEGQEHRDPGYTDDCPPLPGDQFPVLRSKQRREASEVSVEALDLADYARTLRTRQREDPYPSFPVASTSSQRDTYSQNPQARYPPHPPSSYPAQIARGGTRSSGNSSSSPGHVSNDRSHGKTYRRPYSLPTSPQSSTPRPPDQAVEIDISQFPAWSRSWYTTGSQRNKQQRPQSRVDSLEAYELEAGLALPQPLISDSSSKRGAPSYTNSRSRDSLATGSHRKPLSPFDPAYIHPQSYPRQSFDDYPSTAAPSYTNHDPFLGDGREAIVPWSYDPPEYGQAPLDPLVKEQRMRMLEKAFGTESKASGKKSKGQEKEVDDGLMRDDKGKLVVGTPDGRGGLVHQGPRMRAAVRFFQILLVVAVGGPIIWAAVALKPNPLPPPAGKLPIYILYVLSPLTLVLLLYLFVVRPCTVRRRFSSSSAHPGVAPGMMVLPVAGVGAGNKKGGKKGVKGGPKRPMPGGKKGKKGKGGGGDVQVNLIVDPTAFGLPAGEDLSSSDEDTELFDDGGMPGSFFGKEETPEDKERARRKKKRRKRRTLVASLKLEEEWKFARGWMRKMAFLDAFVSLLWGVASGFVIAGNRCPTGGKDKGFGGWCTAYNASTAASCLLCVLFSVSVFFGVKDLYASKLSPRTRM